MDENVNGLKTCLIVLIFTMIMVMSGYIVYSKVDDKNKIDSNKKNEIDSVLVDSKIVTELSINNKDVKRLYNFVNNNNIDYASYKIKGKEINWDYVSLVTMYNIPDNYILTDEENKTYVDKYSFKDKYNEVFGELYIEEESTNACASMYYKDDVYYANWYCSTNDKTSRMVTYFKNATVSSEYLNINKYYAFLVRIEGTSEYELYSSDVTSEDNLIATNILVDEIPNYIDGMNIMSYKFKKALDNNYYLNNVE